jgi:hypothetical protein
MLSSGTNVIIWDKMISCGANFVMLSFGANVIIWCYHVMLSSGMIPPPFFSFPENFTHSGGRHRERYRQRKYVAVAEMREEGMIGRTEEEE